MYGTIHKKLNNSHLKKLTYVRVLLHFYSKDWPYYEVSESVLTLRMYVQVSIWVNKNVRVGHAHFYI